MSLTSTHQTLGTPFPVLSKCNAPGLGIPYSIDSRNPRCSPDWCWKLITDLEVHDPEPQYPWADPWRKLVRPLRQVEAQLPSQGQQNHRLPYAIFVAENMAFFKANSTTVGASSSRTTLGGVLGTSSRVSPWPACRRLPSLIE
jgi:hypothetical protein